MEYCPAERIRRRTNIKRGAARQNANGEHQNRTVRGEWMGRYIFEISEEVQRQVTEWPWTYTHPRTNMGIGGITPAMKLKMVA